MVGRYLGILRVFNPGDIHGIIPRIGRFRFVDDGYAVETADYSDLEGAVYKKTMEMIGEDAKLKVCTQF